MRAIGSSRAAALAVLVFLVSPCGAFPYFATTIPNGGSVPAESGLGPCAGVGHESCFGGGPRNPFGVDFAAAGHQWTADLCRTDSDGDGLTNGQELGDPCCLWSAGGTSNPTFSQALSHPGLAGSTALMDEFDCALLELETVEAISEPAFFVEGETQLQQTFDLSYEVQPKETEYINFPYSLQQDGEPLTEPLYMTGWEVDIDNLKHVHHFVGYTCKQPLNDTILANIWDDLAPGLEMLRYKLGCGTTAIVWVPGMNHLVFPDNVAMPFGPGTEHQSIIVQVHFDNPELVAGVFDSSSLTVHFTDKPREHNMGIYSLGDQILSFSNVIPAQEESWFVSARCLVETKDDEEVTVFAHMPHMHWFGRRLWSEKIASGGGPSDAAHWGFGTKATAGGQPLESFGRVDTYDADLQQTYILESPYKIQTGDLVATTCVYDTTGTTEDVFGGFASQQEMCVDFVMYWPADGLEGNFCTMRDPSVSGKWPAELYSVVEKPDLLEILLAPNSKLPKGYDSSGNDMVFA